MEQQQPKRTSGLTWTHDPETLTFGWNIQAKWARSETFQGGGNTGPGH